MSKRKVSDVILKDFYFYFIIGADITTKRVEIFDNRIKKLGGNILNELEDLETEETI